MAKHESPYLERPRRLADLIAAIQAMGVYPWASREVAAKLTHGQAVEVKSLGRGKYGRTIAEVFLPDGSRLNAALVRAGACWWWPRFAPEDDALAKAQAEARAAKRGLWVEPDAIAPWEWRKEVND